MNSGHLWNLHYLLVITFQLRIPPETTQRTRIFTVQTACRRFLGFWQIFRLMLCFLIRDYFHSVIHLKRLFLTLDVWSLPLLFLMSTLLNSKRQNLRKQSINGSWKLIRFSSVNPSAVARQFYISITKLSRKMLHAIPIHAGGTTLMHLNIWDHGYHLLRSEMGRAYRLGSTNREIRINYSSLKVNNYNVEFCSTLWGMVSQRSHYIS